MNKIKLKKLAKVIAGQSPESAYYNLNGDGMPFLQGNRTFGNINPNINTWTTKITKIAPSNSVLISVRAPVGDLNITKDDICIGRGLASINAFDGDNRFIYYCLKYNLKSIINQSNGTTFFSINKNSIENILLIVPKNTKNVSELLSVLDNKIEINNRINAELEAMAKTLYDYWFVQFDFPNADGKPYKSSGGIMVYNEMLKREIPEGWEVKPLKGNVKFERGISYTSKEIENNDGIPMINLASISIDRKYRSKLKFYSGNSINKKVSYGDMLIACTDLTRNAHIIGSPIIVPKEYEEYTFSMDLTKMEITTDRLKQNYLYMSLITDYYHNFIKWYASGTNVLHLDLKGIEYYPMLFPNIDIQKKFAYKIKIIEEKKAIIINENHQLASLRNWLLPMLMNGQVGFKEITYKKEVIKSQQQSQPLELLLSK